MTLLEDIRKVMEDEEISQRELARRLSCSEPWMSRLLKDDHNLTFLTAERIARALGRRLDVRLVK